MSLPNNARLLISGTERFNVVMQQYPLHYQLSASRNEKFIKETDLKKYDRPVSRKLNSNRTPKEFQELVDTGTYVWYPKGPDKEILCARDAKPVMRNQYREGLEAGTYMWANPMKQKKPVLCYVYLSDPNKIDITRGSEGRVVANPEAAGTAKLEKINGQALWRSGPGAQWSRKKLKEQLMNYFTPRITSQLPASIWAPKGSFIQLEYIFFLKLDGAYGMADYAQDQDNHAMPYMKVFKDTLQHLGVIKGDDPRYMRGSYAHYVHVETEEERRLEVKFHFCTNTGTITKPVYEIIDDNVDGESQTRHSEDLF